MASLTSPSTQIDPNGDLHLEVVSKDNHFLGTFFVNSGCMRMASSIYPKLVTVKEGRNHITLRNVNIQAVEIVLHAVHFQLFKLPSTMSFDDVVQVAHICYTYGLEEVMHPHLKKWAYPWLLRLGQPGYAMWLLVALALRCCDLIRCSISVVTRTLELRGGDFFSDDVNLSNSLIPRSVLSEITAFRQHILENIIRSANETVEKYSEVTICKHSNHARECALISFGSLMAGLKNCSWWPHPPNRETMKDSIDSIIEQLGNIEVLRYPGHDEDACGEPCFRSEAHRWAGSLDTVTLESCQCSQPLHTRTNHSCSPDPLLPWEHYATSRFGFNQKDFQVNVAEQDSDSEMDEDFEPEDISFQPPEEFMDDAEANAIKQEEGDETEDNEEDQEWRMTDYDFSPTRGKSDRSHLNDAQAGQN